MALIKRGNAFGLAKKHKDLRYETQSYLDGLICFLLEIWSVLRKVHAIETEGMWSKKHYTLVIICMYTRKHLRNS